MSVCLAHVSVRVFTVIIHVILFTIIIDPVVVNVLPEQITENSVRSCNMESAFRSGGIGSCLQMIKEKLKQLEISPINVAVVGNSAVGKSSFINTIRSLAADDETAAPVAAFQSTLDIHDYLHPRVPQLKFWDLPGVGSMQFPKETYFRDVIFDRFDFFILLTAQRFTETDAWLGHEIRKCEKKYFFVRTHIDEDISNDRKAHPNSHNEDALIDTIHKYTVENLKAHGLSDVPVFLVSNYDRPKYDFHRIEQQLIEELPAIRKNTAVLYKRSAIREMIEVAGRSLIWRLWMYSVLSAAAASVPNYFMSAGLLAVFVLHWSHVCFDQFGLDDMSLEHYARIMSASSRKLQEIVRKNFEERANKTTRWAGMIVGILGIPAFRLLAELVLRQYPPYLSVIISATASFVAARWLFGHMLKIPKKVALTVADTSAGENTDKQDS